MVTNTIVFETKTIRKTNAYRYVIFIIIYTELVNQIMSILLNGIDILKEHIQFQ